MTAFERSIFEKFSAVVAAHELAAEALVGHDDATPFQAYVPVSIAALKDAVDEVERLRAALKASQEIVLLYGCGDECSKDVACRRCAVFLQSKAALGDQV